MSCVCGTGRSQQLSKPTSMNTAWRRLAPSTACKATGQTGLCPLEEFVARDPNRKIFDRLIKLHPGLVMAYLNPDGRRVAIYRSPRWKTKREYRWTVYAKNWRITHASTEGYKNLKKALANASMPSALPPVPELGNGILFRP